MPKIQQLSAHVADLIAAGEVVERPASAAKELVENSIDAGAKNITVEIQNGGMTFLRVTDDGCGMLPEDAETAFLRHATSKLRTERDLEAIRTLGFRGEALAAICAVSRIDLLTKTAEAQLGTSLHLEAGVVTEREEAGCPNGTTIIVRDLFYNTPARMKFMKTDAYEGAVVASSIAKLALAHPEVSIRVIKDGKEEFHTVGDGQLLSAIRAVMGREIAQQMVELDSHYDKYTLTGFITKPTVTRGNRANQIFFVNGRHVRSAKMTAALEEAYTNRLMSGRFPSCVLHLHLPEHMVDVNVHPAKIEVKFTNEKAVFDCIRYGVEGALDKASAKVSMQLPKQPTPDVPKQPMVASQTHSAYRTMSAAEFRGYAQLLQGSGKSAASQNADTIARPHDKIGSASTLPELPEFTDFGMPQTNLGTPKTDPVGRDDLGTPKTDPVGRDDLGTPQKNHDTPQTDLAAQTSAPAHPTADEQQTFALPTQTWRIVGEVMDTYIIVEQGRSMLLIDKHAAHERLLFEKFRKQKDPIVSQLLLTPIVFHAEREEAAVLLENEALLTECGFAVSDYGDGALAIGQIPTELSSQDAVDTLGMMATDLKNGKQLAPYALRDKLLHTVSCKAAIKGGQKSAPSERESIVREVLSREDLKYCPHGRPICLELTDKQIEKQFKR